MHDDCPISRKIIDRQDRLFREEGLCERRDLDLSVLKAETGIPVETLKTYRRIKSRAPSIMSLANFVKLARALPDDLANLLIEDSGYTLTPTNKREKDWLALAERAAALASKVCRFQHTGGHIDHQEDAELTEELSAFAADARAMVIA